MNTMKRTPFFAACAALLFVVVGCEDKSAPKSADWPAVPKSESAPAPAPAQAGAGAPSTPQRAAGDGVEIGGLLWKFPSEWRDVGASGMRIAEYAAGPEGSAASIRFFSTQGSAQANIDRWKGQVKDPTDGPTTKTISAGALTAHTVAVTGTYSGMGPGGVPTPPAAGTRMLGAFIEGGPRPIQVLVTGPDATVRSIEAAWEQALAGVQVAQPK